MMQGIEVQGKPWLQSTIKANLGYLMRPYLKSKMGVGMSLQFEYMASMCKALGLFPRSSKKLIYNRFYIIYILGKMCHY